MKLKFSKSYGNIFDIKKDFYYDNKKNYLNILKINKKYINQPNRKNCKICNKKLTKKIFFQHLINYSVCKNCGHLNGLNEDTKKFTNWLYNQNKGKNYSAGYTKDFSERVKKIYLPKAKFLKDVLKKKINLIDFGSGGGHFLKALELKKINAVGFETNATLMKLAKKKLKTNKIFSLESKNFNKIIADKNYNVFSMIAVLEHLNNPHEIMKLFIKSKIQYLYLSIPLFSLSVLIENSFKNIFPRHLGGAHTHLFTRESINFFKNRYRLKSVGEWWFGTDIPDLMRSLQNSSNTYNKLEYNKFLSTYLYSVIDELQNVLDKNKICSEVHLILKKK